MVKNKNILIMSLILIMAFMAFSVFAADTITITDVANRITLARNQPLNYSGEGTCFGVNVSSSESNLDASALNNVTVIVFSTSASGSNAILVRLNETGVNTGVFNILVNSSNNGAGEAMGSCVNVSTGASNNGTLDTTNYSILVSDDASVTETINATFNVSTTSVISDSIIMQQSAVVYWLNAGTGVLYANTTYGYPSTDEPTFSVFGIGVNDSGRNLHPGRIDNVTVNLTTSSGESVEICLNESGADTGIFNVQAVCVGADVTENPDTWEFGLWSGTTADDSNRLAVVEGDNINLSVRGDVLFDASSTDKNDLVWLDTEGEVFAGSTTALTPDDSTSYSNIVNIYDNGTNADYAAIDSNVRYATLSSYSVGWELLTSITVGLNETGVNTGLFNLNTTIFANTNSTYVGADGAWASVSEYHIEATEGGFINITYSDANNFTGTAPLDTLGPIKIDVFDKGILQFNWSTEGAALGTADNLLFKVNDSDLNLVATTAENATFIISSDNCIAASGVVDTGFAEVVLNESNENGDTSSTDSAVFGIPHNYTTDVGLSFVFETGNVLGDTEMGCWNNGTHVGINVTAGDKIYLNYTDVDGGGGVTSLTSWMDQVGNLNTTDIYGIASSVFSVPGAVYANVFDHGKNTNNATSDAVDCVTATINSTSDNTGFTFGLNESGESTGIFNVSVASCSSRTSVTVNLTTGSASDSTNKNLNVTEGNTVNLIYDDDKGFDGSNPANDTNSFNVQYTGTISFDKTRYHANNDAVVVSIVDLDNRTQTNISFISLSSSADFIGVNLTLNRSGSGTSSVFNITVNKNTGAGTTIYLNSSATKEDDNCGLNVTAGGWIMANYTDASSGSVISTGKVLVTDTATMSFNSTRFVTDGTALGYNVSVYDIANNTDSTAADTINIRLNSTANTTLRTFTATETGVNTGIFAFTFDVSTSAQDSDTVLVNTARTEQYIYAYYDVTYNTSGLNPSGYGDQNGPLDLLEQVVGYYTASAPVLDLSAYNASEDTATSTANFTLVDYDLNQDNDAVDTISVYYNSDYDTTHTKFTVSETGANTGIFANNSITFDNLTTAGHSGFTINVIQGGTFAVWFEDTLGDGSTASNRTDYAVINKRVTVSGGNAGGEGWDLISVPMTLADTSVSTAMRGVSYNAIYWYNDTSDEWETPTTMEPLKGYAVQVNATQYAYVAPITSTLDTSRTMPTPSERTLSTGWNMISVNNISAYAASEAFASLISSTAATTPTWSVLKDWTGLEYADVTGSTTSSKSLDPTVGYWIHIRQDSSNRDLLPGGKGR